MALGNAYLNMSDEQLMVLVCQRNTRAFGVLYDRYSRPLYNYFHRMLWKDRERARDFTQELFAKLVHKPEAFDPARTFRTWLFSVAHNMCKNEYAREEVRRGARNQLHYMNGVEQPDGGRSTDRARFMEELDAALSRLDEVKRTTFELRFRQDLSIQEISEIMQCSEGTVKSRLFYILKELNQQLKVFQGLAHLLAGLLMSFIAP